MKIALIGCARSGVLARAFRGVGWEAWECELKWMARAEKAERELAAKQEAIEYFNDLVQTMAADLLTAKSELAELRGRIEKAPIRDYYGHRVRLVRED